MAAAKPQGCPGTGEGQFRPAGREKDGLGPAEAAGGRFKQPGQLLRPAAHGAHRCLAGGAAAPGSARPGAAYLQLPAAAGMETWFELIQAARGPNPGTARCNKETALRRFNPAAIT